MIPFTLATPQSEILIYKSKKIVTRSVQGKLQTWQIKEEIHQWGNFPCSKTGWLSLVKMSSYSMQSQSLSQYGHIDKMLLKYTWRSTRSRITNLKWKEKNKIRGLTLPDLKTHYKFAAIKTVSCWWRNKQIYQWSRIETWI